MSKRGLRWIGLACVLMSVLTALVGYAAQMLAVLGALVLFQTVVLTTSVAAGGGPSQPMVLPIPRILPGALLAAGLILACGVGLIVASVWRRPRQSAA